MFVDDSTDQHIHTHLHPPHLVFLFLPLKTLPNPFHGQLTSLVQILGVSQQQVPSQEWSFAYPTTKRLQFIMGRLGMSRQVFFSCECSITLLAVEDTGVS